MSQRTPDAFFDRRVVDRHSEGLRHRHVGLHRPAQQMGGVLDRRTEHLRSGEMSAVPFRPDADLAHVLVHDPSPPLVAVVDLPKLDLAADLVARDTHDRHLRFGEDDRERDTAGVGSDVGPAGGIGPRVSTLVGRFVQELSFAVDVSCDEDRSLAALHRTMIETRHAALVEFDPGIVQLEALEVRFATRGAEHSLERVFVPSAVPVGPRETNTVVDAACLGDIDTQSQVQLRAHDSANLLRDDRILHCGDLLDGVEERGLHPQSAKRLAQLESDGSGAEHGDRFGQVAQLEHVVRREEPIAEPSVGRRYERRCPGGDDARAGLDPGMVVDFEGRRSDEPGPAVNPLVFPELLDRTHDGGDEAVTLRANSLQHRRAIDLHRSAVHPEDAGMTSGVRGVSGCEQELRWHASDASAGCAVRTSLDQDHPLRTMRARLSKSRESGGAGSDDRDVGLESLHEATLATFAGAPPVLRDFARRSRTLLGMRPFAATSVVRGTGMTLPPTRGLRLRGSRKCSAMIPSSLLASSSRPRLSLLLGLLLPGLGACGPHSSGISDMRASEAGDAPDADPTRTPEEAVVGLVGRVHSLGTPIPGAFVLALDERNQVMSVTRTDDDGGYRLSLTEVPAKIAAKAWQYVPRYERLEASPGADVIEHDVELGLAIGADGTAENLIYVVDRDEERVVPQLAWGSGGAIGGGADELGDLVRVGARHPEFLSLVPEGVRLVPSVDQAVERVSTDAGDYLVARFSAELDGYNLGAAGTEQLINQLVSTLSLNAGPQRLPVRLEVACDDCEGGFEPMRDGHVGATELGGSYPVLLPEPEAVFSDIEGHRYARHIAAAEALGVTTGYPDGDFRPDAFVTRAELASFLVAGLKLELERPEDASFDDVEVDAWYFPAVETAVAHGVLSERAPGRFEPERRVTRAELAGYVVHAAGWPAPEQPRATFSDVGPEYWAFERIATAYGYCRSVEPRAPATSVFAPVDAATRAEAVAAVVRMKNCFVGNEIGG